MQQKGQWTDAQKFIRRCSQLIIRCPEHEELLKELQEILQEDELGIQLIKSLSERVIKSVISQDVVSNFLSEDQLQVLLGRKTNIKAWASKHEVTVKFLVPADFEFIVSDAMAWKQFITELIGPT